MNNIIDFKSSPHVIAAKKEKTFDAIRYQTAVSILERLHKDKEITNTEFKEIRAHLARRFKQITDDGDCVGI